MKIRQTKVKRLGPFPDSSTFNPWLIAVHTTNWINPHAESAGFTTNQQRHGRRPFDLTRDVGELFLENTTLNGQRAEWLASMLEYFSSHLAPLLTLSGSESTDALESIPLPEPKTLEMSLGLVTNMRHSVRKFSGDPMQLDDLATLCYAAAGITHTTTGTPVDGGPNYEFQCRSVPSSGGLYGLDCYCYAMRVAKLPPFTYKYMPYYHSLEKLHPEAKAERFLESCVGADETGLDLDKLAVVMVIVGNPQKAVRKYGARGVRYLLLEAGMMAMSMDLTATALGYGSLHYQSFLDDKIEETLAITDRPNYVLHTLLLGWPADTNLKGR